MTDRDCMPRRGAEPVRLQKDHQRTALYRTIWRWHFYAALFTAPFLLILAVTGSMYLFQSEFENWLYRDLRQIAAPAEGPTFSIEAQLAAASAARPDTIPTRVVPPLAPHRSTEVVLTDRVGNEETIFVDPTRGTVIGSRDENWRVMTLVRALHGRLFMGRFGDALMELAASWTVVLLITGVYLWWPRPAFSIFGVILPRLRAKGRFFWRDLHAVSGIWVFALLGFLAITGLPWTGVAGGALKQLAAAFNAGTPAGVWDRRPLSTPPEPIETPNGHSEVPVPAHHGSETALGWSESTFRAPPSLAGSSAPAPKLEAIIALAQEKLSPLPFQIFFPRGERGVYTISTFPDGVPDDPTKRVMLHIDRYSGSILQDIRWRDYGPIGKAVEYGVAIHTGKLFGAFNQFLMLTACIGAVVMIIAGIVMWWSRRPRGRIGAPSRPGIRLSIQIVAAIFVVAAFLPMVGLSLIIILLLDSVVLTHLPKLRAALQ